VLETLFSTLHAPIQMLFHTRFVAMTLLGIEAHWNTQQRSAAGTRWRDAWRQHWAQTTIGLGWAVLTWRLDAPVFWWFLPVFAGLVLSVPLSVFTSSDRLGSFLRRAGLLLTPEETAPPAQFSAPDFLPTPEAANGPEALRRAIRDPYLNAIHVSLLRNRPPWPHEKATEAGKLGRQLLHRGPNSLTAAEQLTVASDPDIMAWLHREYWLHFEQMERGGGGME
jgi:membrane glycosyltransferase